MVVTRSMAARRTPLALALPLPHDMVVEIAGHIAATSPRPMADICSLRATCQAMRAACQEGAVGSRVALEREHAMRWFENDRYLALVRNLAGAGNPEACFVLGLTLTFAERERRGTGQHAGTEWLGRAAAAGHKVAAYVLAVLYYRDREARAGAEQYIRQVEGEPAPAPDDGCEAASRITNRECVRCRDQAVQAVRDVTWNVATLLPVALPPLVMMMEEDGGQSCKGGGCGVPEGWTGGCAVFCTDACRIRHEYSEFFSRVSLPVA